MDKSRGTEFGADINDNTRTLSEWQQRARHTNHLYRPTINSHTPSKSIPSEYPGEHQSSEWTVDFIVRQLLEQPRSQFNVYYNGRMHPAMQKEIVQYKTQARGHVRRNELSKNKGELLNVNMVGPQLVRDLERFRDCYFTFISMPTQGRVASSENRDYLNKYQVTFPQPITLIRVPAYGGR